MKIAILTLPLNSNYGGILQAFALQTALEDMGHNVDVLNPSILCKPIPTIMKPLKYGKRLIDKYIFKNIETIFLERKYMTLYRNIHQFINKYVHIREIDNKSELKENEYDAIIVGSDQVWRYYSNIPEAFLSFAEKWNIKKIAYAASFGTDYWPIDSNDTEECARLAKKFDAISVREDSAVKLCKDYLGVDAKWVLDPTLLIDKEKYIEIIRNSNATKKEEELFAYLLDRNKMAETLISSTEKTFGLKSFTNNSIDFYNINIPIKERIQPPLEDWLLAMHESKLIVTDSFHACVFSIIFNKPFIVVSNNKRGNARIESLLGMINQKYRHITNFSNIENIPQAAFNNPNADNIIKTRKEESLDFLRSAIGL